MFDLIASREKKDVVELLKRYPNIEKVTRDGSRIYAVAISEAFPDVLQISDRFHLIQNLTVALKADLKILLPRQIPIDDAVILPEEKRYSPINEYNQEQYNSSKFALITAVRKRFEECPVYTIVQNEFGITYPTLKSYLTCDAIHKKKSGYYKKNAKSVQRKHLVKLLYDRGVSDLPVDNETQKNILAYLKRNRNILSFIVLATEFRTVLYSGNPQKLDAWLNKARTFSAQKNLQFFIDGVLDDIDAIQNAILYAESNGVVEGCVYKIKLIKRTMYGRCKFPLLKTKVLNQFQSKAKSFYDKSSSIE